MLCLWILYITQLLVCGDPFCREINMGEICDNDWTCVPDECGVLKYVCYEQFAVQPGMCPFYNKRLEKMDVTKCTEEQICPEEGYVASALEEKGRDCLLKPKVTRRCMDPDIVTALPMEKSRNETHLSSSETTNGSEAGVAAGVTVALLITALIVLVVFYRKNQFGFRDKLQLCFMDCRGIHHSTETGTSEMTPLEKEGTIESKLQKLGVLLKYVVHILKMEIGSNDLKEKSIIHSKSLKEFFRDSCLEELYKDDVDYEKLCMPLVFVLVRNFCVKIDPPRKGWDSEPTDDEDTVGADISRIFLMWIMYSDNCYDFKNLDVVFNRMSKRYGTAALDEDQYSKELPTGNAEEVEEFKEKKYKIMGIQLKPDCFVENGIVITEGIQKALEILQIENLVICKGVIGCGKTHALKAIAHRYQEKGWKSRWVKGLLTQEKKLGKNTIVICDNFLGKFACDTFSPTEISKTETLLQKIIGQCGHIKIAIGVHKHVFDELKLYLSSQMEVLQNTSITVNLENLTKSEMLLILKEQAKGNWKSNPICDLKKEDFVSVIYNLSQSHCYIGYPFKFFMYLNHRDFHYDFSEDPLKALIQNFKNIDNSSDCYLSLIYLMCVGEQHCKEDLEKWTKLTKDKLHDTALKKPAYFRAENNIETLVHEILTIALFKAAVQANGIFRDVINHCDIEMLLQLLRPFESECNPFICCIDDLEKEAQVGDITHFLLRRLKQGPYKTKWDKLTHPLKNHKLFMEK